MHLVQRNLVVERVSSACDCLDGDLQINLICPEAFEVLVDGLQRLAHQTHARIVKLRLGEESSQHADLHEVVERLPKQP